MSAYKDLRTLIIHVFSVVHESKTNSHWWFTNNYIGSLSQSFRIIDKWR